jgi:hypothetical protein
MGHLRSVTVHILLLLSPFGISDSRLCSISLCLGLDSLHLFRPNIWHPPCFKPKTTLVMPLRRFSQQLHPDEGLPQAFDQSQLSLHQPPSQTLSTIVKGSEQPTFGDIPKLQLHQPVTMSNTVVGSSQNGGGTSSTQTNRGDPRQSPPRVLPPVQDIQGDAELD